MSGPSLPADWLVPAKRVSPRLHRYDYASPGTYFITVCAAAGRYLFGEIADGEVCLTDAGRVVESCWLESPRHFPMVELDVYAVMPNHVHGLVTLHGTEEVHASERRPTLHTIVGSFKSTATRRVNVVRNTPGVSLWQRAYHEHVVRSEQELERIREYIVSNPAQWEFDEENHLRQRSGAGTRCRRYL